MIGLAAAFAMNSKHAGWRRIASWLCHGVPQSAARCSSSCSPTSPCRSLGIRIGKIESFILTLAIYAGAYLAEVFRGALLALPRGLREAGLAIGLTEWQTKVWIIIPVMLRNAFPSLGNNFISLFKDTSLAAAIAVPELTFYARKINTRELPRDRDLAGGQPDVCRRLLPDRRAACASSSGAWRSRADMLEQGTFLYELWVSRWAHPAGRSARRS